MRRFQHVIRSLATPRRTAPFGRAVPLSLAVASGLALLGGGSDYSCESPSASSSIHAGSSSDAAGESDGDALGPLHTLDVEGTRGGEPDDGLTNPGDFDDLEDSRSFRVQEVDGVFMMLISMLGTPGGPQDREPAMAQVQFQLGSKSADASLVVQDTRLPSVQAMVTQSQPGAGRLLQLTAQHRLAPGINLKGEAALGASMIVGGNVQVKHDGDDFHSSLTVSSGQQGNTAELSYHQALTPTTTGGGSLSATLGPRMLPRPDVTALTWGVFGSWHDPRRESYALGRYDSSSGMASARYWRQAHKSLALGAALGVGLGGEGGAGGSTLSAGMKHTLGTEAGNPSTLTANFTSDLKSSVAWSKQNSATSQNISNTFFQTTLSGVFDHKSQEHKLGLQLIFQY